MQILRYSNYVDEESESQRRYRLGTAMTKTQICLTSKPCWLSLDHNMVFPELGNNICENTESKESPKVSCDLEFQILEPAVTLNFTEADLFQ